VRRTRLALRSPVSLYEGDATHLTELLDISLSGARVRRPASWRGVDQLPLLLEIASDSGETLRVGARVARESADELALSFDHVGRGEEAALAELLARRGSLTDGLE
jgi:hypothetical protein